MSQQDASNGAPEAVALELLVGARRVPLDPGRVTTIGRDVHGDVVIDHPEVSRRHAEVFFEPALGWILRDPGSANGVYVHAQRVPAVRLAAGVAVTLGPSATAPTMTVVAAHSDSVVPERTGTIVVGHRCQHGPMTIGRGPDNTVVLDDLLVSRRHARATRRGDGYLVEDLSSLNGTFVNGNPISTAYLRPNDLLTVGHHEFHIVDGELLMAPPRTEVSFVASDLHVVLPSGNQILGGVGFALPASSLLAVIGPSGAGKSTLLNALTGARKATSGQVLFDGRDLYDNFHELRHRIGVVPQDDVVHRQLTVRQALGYASQLRFPSDLEATARQARIAQVVSELGLEEHLDTRIDRLSGGQRKRTSVALELLTQPSLLFLDEPTSGLDPGLDKSVMTTLRQLADGGRTVVVITHSVANLGLCDRVLLLAPGGRVAYFGPPDQVLPYFHRDDYADVFSDVSADPERAAAAYDQHSRVAGSPSTAQPVRVAEPAAHPHRAQPILRQASILVRRHARVLVSDRSYALFMALLPVVLAVLVMTVPGGAGFGPPEKPPTGEPMQLLVVLIVGAAFMGVASSSRDLVGERAIFTREKAVGLSPGAYLGAKLILFAGLAAIQSLVLTGAVLLVKHRPDTASLLGNGSLELYLAVAGTAFASAVMGLLISALVSTSEQVMPLLVISIMGQLVLCGGLIPVTGRAGLEQLSWLVPSRWGFAAGASTIDVLRKVPGESDALWKHSASAWIACELALLVLATGFAGVTAWRLSRVGHRR